MAAVVGLLAGSWSPQTDLRLLREAMQHEQSVRKVSGASGFDAFAKLTGIPDVARRKPAKMNETATTTNAFAAAEPPKRPSGRESFRQQMKKEDLRARIDKAADLWRACVDLSTAQWKGKLGLSDDKRSEAFDAAIADVNEALRETMQATADEIEFRGRMTPELALRLTVVASRIMVETYDTLGAALPEDRRAELSEMPVFEFVDPSVAEPLIGVQDKLEGSIPERGR